MSKKQLHLDLHPIAKNGPAIEQALSDIIDAATTKKARQVEIICGKGTGQLKKRVLKFLDRKDIKQQYHRIDKDANNHGRIFVHFKNI